MTRRLTVACILVAIAALLIPAGSAQAPTTPFRILVTNDDGVRAPGIAAVAAALRTIGEVTVVAPSENQSGKGHSISITDPIYADSVTWPDGTQVTALAATPASCVKVALDAPLVSRPPDLVVSGINRGYNVGMVTYVSGTIGAAREAALHGIPAIAASLASAADPHYEAAAAIVVRLATTIRARGLEPGVFLNVNVPPGALDTLRGIRVTTQSALGGVEKFEEQKAPNGRRYYWNIWQDPKRDIEGTDVWAVGEGYVAVTPMHAGEFDARTFEQWKGINW